MKKVLQQTLFRLQALLLLAVMFVVGSSVWAQDATFNFRTYLTSAPVNGVTVAGQQSEDSSVGSYGMDIWGNKDATYKLAIACETEIVRIEFEGKRSNYDYGGDVVAGANDDFTYVPSGTSVWKGESKQVTFYGTSSETDFYVLDLRVWLKTEDGGETPAAVTSSLSFAGTLNSYYNESGVQTSLGGGDNFYGGGYFLFDNGAKMTFNTSGSNGWSNSAQRIRISSGCSFTVSAPEGYELTAIDFTTDGTNSLAGLSTTSGLTKQSNQKATWAGKADNVVFSTTDITFITTMKVTLMPVAEEGEVTYTIDLVDAPTGAYVTLDEQRFEDYGTYTIEKNFGKNDLTVYEPEGYYAEVEYTRDNHTYTVTYHAYNYYDVTVTGTTDPAAGVVYNTLTYGNGGRIETKEVLTESSVTAAEVANMKGTVSMTGNTYNVDYQEKLDFVIKTNTGSTNIRQDGFTITGGGTYTGNCINLWNNWKFTVTSSTFPIERIELEEYNNKTITASSSPEGYQGNNVWVGTPTNSVEFTATNGGDFCIKSVHVYLYKPQPVNYTFEFVNAPDEAYITIDGQTINKVNDGYTVAKVFTAESVTSVYEPDGYYADVEYNEENHKFTITYHQGSYVSFGNSWEQKEEITYDPYWSGGSVYQTSWDGYGRVFFRCSTKKITKIELRFDGDASPIIDGNGFGSVTANGNTAIWTAPAEGTATDICIYSTSSDGRNVVSSKVFYEALPDIDYPVVIAVDGTLPADFTPSVTVDGENFTESGTHSTPKTLTGSEASATTPDNGDWYYDVAYAEATNTFTVTYKEYLHYIVSVVGCEDETAGVRNGSNTFHDGDKINVKEALTAEALTAVTVNGYDVEAPVVGEGTVTVTYAVAGLVDYAVTITGMPAGASVKIEDQVFDENTDNGVHQSNKTLSSSVVTIQNCPETHYTNESSEWFDAEGKAFNIAFIPYLVYTVAVDEASAYQGGEAGVKVFNANTYLPGQPIYNKTALTVNDVKATDVDGYTGTVTLADNVFTVSYVKDAFIKFDASAIAGFGSVNETKDGVTLQCWDSDDYFTVGEQTNYSYIITSSGAPIVKVEIDYKWPDGDHLDYCNTGSLNADLTVWNGSTNELRLKNSNGWGIDVYSLKVYLAQATTYHVNITGMPAEGASVVVNNNTYDTNGNYDFVSYEELNENNVTVNVPQSHKYEKTYTEGTHTFDVTYTALDKYTVVADADNAYTGDGAGIKATIDLGPRNYTFGDTFYNDGALEASAIEVNEVDGYTGTFVLDDDADPKTITVKYVENASETYTVEFAGNVPAGASVTITDASGDHVINASDDELTYSTRYTVTEASAKAKQFEYYDATVTLDGTTFTVTYDNVDYILVDLSNATGYELTRKSAEETVAVDFVVYNKCANLFGDTPITVTSNTYNIKKIEYVLAENYSDEKKAGTQFNRGAWTTEYEVWETNEYKTKSVVLSVPNGEPTDICYTAVKVYLDTDPVGQFAMSAAGWATLCVNDDFILPEDYTAYTVGKLEGSTPVLEEDGQIVFTEIERVPAGTPVIICGPENANVSLLPTYGAVAPEVNYLYGNNSNEAITYYAAGIADQGLGELDTNTWEYTYGSFGPCQLYQLAKENDLVGFYRQVADGVSLKCGAHKAFLVVPSTVAASNARFVFPGQDGELTGISGMATDNVETIYNLQGQRVTATKAGVYVKNGRKFIVK